MSPLMLSWRLKRRGISRVSLYDGGKVRTEEGGGEDVLFDFSESHVIDLVCVGWGTFFETFADEGVGCVG